MTRAEAILNHIGPAIKARREAVGRSLEEVAADAGTSKSHIWALEQGRSKNPTILMLLNVCEALSTTLNSLLGVDVSQPVLSEQELELIHHHRRIFATRRTETKP
jgi:transcriptional regulator with XRE-family HTH domain